MTRWRVWVWMLCGQQRPGCEGLPATPALWAHAPAPRRIPASPGLLPCSHRGAARRECEKALSGDSLLQVAGELSPKIIPIKRGACKRGSWYTGLHFIYLFYHVLVACKHGERAFFLTVYFTVPLPLHSLSLQTKTHEQYFSGPFTSIQQG